MLTLLSRFSENRVVELEVYEFGHWRTSHVESILFLKPNWGMRYIPSLELLVMIACTESGHIVHEFAWISPRGVMLLEQVGIPLARRESWVTPTDRRAADSQWGGTDKVVERHCELFRKIVFSQVK